MLQPFNKKHTKLNRPHREVPIDILTIWSAITARLRNRPEKLGIWNRLGLEAVTLELLSAAD